MSTGKDDWRIRMGLADVPPPSKYIDAGGKQGMFVPGKIPLGKPGLPGAFDPNGSVFGRPAGVDGPLPNDFPTDASPTTGGGIGVAPPAPWLAGLGGGGGSSTTLTAGGAKVTPPEQFKDVHGLGSAIADRIKAIMGGETRFSPEVMASMRGGLHNATQGKLQRTREAIGTDAVSRGMYRSGATSAALADAEMGAASDYTTGVRDIMVQKAMYDFQDKMAGLQAAEQDLERQQQFYLTKDMHQIQRDQLTANIELQRLSIQNARESLQAQLQQQWQLANLQIEGRDYLIINGQKVPIAALGQFGGFMG